MSQPESGASSRKYRREPAGKQTLYRPSRDERDRSAYSGFRGKSRQAAADPTPPTILLKTRANETRSLSPVQQVNKTSADSSTSEAASKDNFKVPPRRDAAGTLPSISMSSPVKFLSEEMFFQDSLHDFLTDNPEFLVVGCVGLQWCGKSTILSHLASSTSREFSKQTVFSVSTSALQMKGLTGTTGLDAYVTNDRIILLDCQPLISAAIAEKELATLSSKDSYKDSLSKVDSSCVGTSVEVQSLQLLSFLYCICHVLIVVQDSLADPNLIRLLQTAEMLKPNLAGDDSVVDHMPHLVVLYNRAQPSDLVPEMLKQTYKFYRLAFQKSRLLITSEAFAKYQNGDRNEQAVNFMPLLEWDATDDQWLNYREAIPSLKKTLLALPRHSFGPTSLNEKTWYFL
nr:EOG090X0EPT [Macrothrix elegans]